MKRGVVLFFEVTTGSVGFWLLWDAMGWQVALAVFLLMWSQNLRSV